MSDFNLAQYQTEVGVRLKLESDLASKVNSFKDRDRKFKDLTYDYKVLMTKTEEQ